MYPTENREPQKVVSLKLSKEHYFQVKSDIFQQPLNKNLHCSKTNRIIFSMY